MSTMSVKIINIYLPTLVKNMSDACPSVRDSSCKALGAAYKQVDISEKAHFDSHFREVEKNKLDKIKQFTEGEPRANQKTAPVAAPAPAAS